MNPLLRYGIATVLCLLCVGIALLSVRKADQHPSTRLFRAIPLSFVWMFGVLTLDVLLQATVPFLATPWFGILGSFTPLGSRAMV